MTDIEPLAKKQTPMPYTYVYDAAGVYCRKYVDAKSGRGDGLVPLEPHCMVCNKPAIELSVRNGMSDNELYSCDGKVCECEFFIPLPYYCEETHQIHMIDVGPNEYIPAWIELLFNVTGTDKISYRPVDYWVVNYLDN